MAKITLISKIFNVTYLFQVKYLSPKHLLHVVSAQAPGVQITGHR